MDLAVEATPLEELRAELIQVTVGPASKLHGVEVFELRLPEGANVTLVVRGGKSFVPENTTVLRRDDQLLVVATAESRSTAEKRVRSISQHGRLAGWQDSGTAGRGDGARMRGRSVGRGAGSGDTGASARAIGAVGRAADSLRRWQGTGKK